MRIGFLNIQGASGKGPQILSLAKNMNLDLLFLCETYLLSTESCGIPGSNIIKNLCQIKPVTEKGKRTTHGLLLYCPNSTFGNTITFLEETMNYMVCKINEYIFVFIYWQPSANDEELVDLIDKLFNTYSQQKLIIFGDLNAQLGTIINPKKPSRPNRRGKLLLDLLDEINLDIVPFDSNNKYGTSTISATGGGNPDIILSNVHIVDATIHESSDVVVTSDHLPITFSVDMDIPIFNKRFSRINIKNFAEVENREKFYNHIDNNLDSTIEYLDKYQHFVELCWEKIKTLLNEAANASLGTINYNSDDIRVKELNNQFWDDDLKQLQQKVINCRKQVHEIIHSNVQQPVKSRAYNELTRITKEYNSAVNQRRFQLFINHAYTIGARQQSSAMMKIIACQQKRKNKSKPKLLFAQIEQHLEYFQSTWGGLPTGEVLEPVTFSTLDNSLIYFESSQIKQACKEIATGKATGVDNIFGEYIRNAGDGLITIIAKLFNIIDNKNTIPEDWLKAMICPVFKNKGVDTDVANYRPIALTSIMRRLFERCLSMKLDKYVQKLSNTQGGFRPNRSTQMQVFNVHEMLARNTNVECILLDFKAAYDMVDRRRLWFKLINNYQIPAKIVHKLQLLFDHNESCLIVEGQRSRFIPNLRGLLQGSSLSPILFNFFIDDLLHQLNSSTVPQVSTSGLKFNNMAFADDIILLANTPNTMKQLLTICETWSVVNGMTFAAAKCIYMGTSNIHNYKIYNLPISAEESPAYLGIPINKYGIDLQTNINKRTNKALKVSHALAESGMNITGFPQEASVRLYKTFIRPTFEYGMQLDILDKDSTVKAQRIQNSVLRTIFGTHRHASINALHKLAQLPFIKDRNKYICARFYTPLINDNGTDLSNPASKFIKNARSTQNSNSLYWKMLANNDLLKFNNSQIINQMFNTNNSSDNICKYPAKEHYREKLETLDTGDTANVAGAINLVKHETARVIFTSHLKLKKPIRVAIIKWLTGGVAQHQDCKKCGLEKGVGRAHALSCSGVDQFLVNYFPIQSTTYQQLNRLDSLINYYRIEADPTIYTIIFRCIQSIYVNCLGYIQKSNGFYTAETTEQITTETNTPNTNGTFQLDTADTIALVNQINQWNKPPLPETLISERYASEQLRLQHTKQKPNGRIYTIKGIKTTFRSTNKHSRSTASRRSASRTFASTETTETMILYQTPNNQAIHHTGAVADGLRTIIRSRTTPDRYSSENLRVP
jgi:Reverse transcriptase (RNA-dependent DNA polymerase)/Endonuclease-reverse transcriptase